MYIVLLASHLENIKRRECIKEALESLFVARPDKVIISYSGVLEFEKDFFENSCRNILKEIDTIFLYQELKKHQFEHYNYMLDYISDDDIISFIDDDDLYHPNKINHIKEIFNKNSNIKVVKHYWYLVGSSFADIVGINEVDKTIKNILDRTEHWCLSIRGNIFKSFFIDNNLKFPYNNIGTVLKQFRGITDTLFICYIESKIKDIYVCKEPLYYQRNSSMKRDYVS